MTKDFDKLRSRQEQKAREAENPQVPEILENDNIIVTPRGAFNKHPTPKIVEPEIFKLELVGIGTSQPMVRAHNKSGSWDGKMTWSKEFHDIFKGQNTCYVIATPDASGKLHPECVIVPSLENLF